MMKKLHSMVKAVLENLLQQLMFLPHSAKWEKSMSDRLRS